MLIPVALIGTSQTGLDLCVCVYALPFCITNKETSCFSGAKRAADWKIAQVPRSANKVAVTQGVSSLKTPK